MILRAIYDRYYPEFVAFDHGAATRQTKVYVPVDIAAVASDIQSDGDLVFGRLYYHLDPKYAREADGVRTPLFQIALPAQNGRLAEHHVVNFPLLESVLASLELDTRKAFFPLIFSALSLVVATLALLATIAINYFGGHAR